LKKIIVVQCTKIHIMDATNELSTSMPTANFMSTLRSWVAIFRK